MATFDEFFTSLDPDKGIRGKQFEKFVKWFIKTDPTWASQVDKVWLWNEYPKRWGADCGIDLIFTHKNGNTWAVQSKCISPNNDIKKSEIDSFLSESNDSKIDGRLLIASTDGIGKNAQQVINRQEKQVVCFLLEQFRQSEIEFPSSIEDLNQGKRKEKKKPRPHQIEAIEKVTQGLKTANRGQVLMACGTGKTLTSLWIKEKLKAKQVLVLVPSLSLLSQTLKEWNAEANDNFKWICICSDKSVAKDKSEDEWISNTSGIGVPVTNEPLKIKNFLDESGFKVVFSTYQSSQLIIEAQEHHDTNDFDLVISDEAHRCAGKVSDAFGSVLDDNKIKALKRLFFTATPRILSENIKTKSLYMDFDVTSMDDHLVFGKILYQLKFSEAIRRNLLSDYQVIVIGVDDEMIKQKIINRELIKVNNETILDAEMIASQIAITKAIKDYDLKRVITFHSTIKSAKDFAESFELVVPFIDKDDLPVEKIKCEYISGKMNSSERNQKISEMKNLEIDQRRILSNARCLSEGVDVPSLSGIAFINPKQSQIDIIQAVGRAIRKSDDKSKGTIVIPLYISHQESLDEAILLSNFKKVWQIAIALKSQDDALMECIDQFRIQKGKEGKINPSNNELDKFIFDIPEKITSRFSKSIKTLLVENASISWLEKFGELNKFKLENGHANPTFRYPNLGSWVNKQKDLYKKKKLNEEQIKLLVDIGFIWDQRDELWNHNFEELKKFKIEHGHLNPSNNKILNTWISSQRSKYKKNKISSKRIKLLEDLGFEWDPLDSSWINQFEELKKFKIEHGHLNNPSMRGWINKQRQRFKNNNLPKEKEDLLKSIEFIWDALEEEWNTKFEELKEYLVSSDGENPSERNHPSLGIWCRTQRRNYKLKNLSQKRIELLKSIGFSLKEGEIKRREDWSKKFEELKEFKKKNGHANPVRDNSEMGIWIGWQRRMYFQKKLSFERIDLLESIGFIWNPVEEFWNRKFAELKTYKAENGHASPPQSHSSLGKWCSQQRVSYKKGKLIQDKINYLESIGFKWKLKD